MKYLFLLISILLIAGCSTPSGAPMAASTPTPSESVNATSSDSPVATSTPVAAEPNTTKANTVPDVIVENEEADYAAVLDSEATSQFQRLWSSTYTKCGNGTYVTRNQNGFVTQVRNVNFVTQRRSVTEADTLNGIEWKGIVTAKYSSERDCTNGCGDWKTAYSHPFAYFEKRHGRWQPPNVMLWRYQKAPCP